MGSPHILVTPVPTPTQSHTAQLCFPCALSQSTLIATVTIVLQEDSSGVAAVTPGVALEKNTEDMHNTPLTVSLKRKEPSCSATQDTSHQAGPSDPKQGCFNGNEGHQAEVEDPYEYGCRIVEEPPPTSHDS